MSSAIQHPRSGSPPGQAAATARGVSIGAGAALTVDGLVMVALAMVAGAPLPLRLVEFALAIGVAAPGVWIAKLGIGGRHPLAVGVLLPEIVLAGALIYLAVGGGGGGGGGRCLPARVTSGAFISRPPARPVFHTMGIAYPVGLAQFLAVLLALGLGSVGLVLSGATHVRADEVGLVSFPLAVRDGVILIVGTILVAIGTGQLAAAQLTPPKWNWISFGAITVPGMLLLIAREMVKQAHRRDPRVRSLPRLMLTEAMLVMGLFLMVFGSIANLTLGANGYVKGLAGNDAGLLVLAVAVVFLFVIRGLGKTLAKDRTGRLGVGGAMLANLAFALGVIVFIAGERSVIVGKSPLPSFGAAFPAAVLIAVVGLLILIPGRVLNATDAAALPVNHDPVHHDRLDRDRVARGNTVG